MLFSPIAGVGQDCLGLCDSTALTINWTLLSNCQVQFDLEGPAASSVATITWNLDGNELGNGIGLQLPADGVQNSEQLIADYVLDTADGPCACQAVLPMPEVVANANWPCECHPNGGDFSVMLNAESSCVPHTTALELTQPLVNPSAYAYTWTVNGGNFEWSAGSSASDAAPTIEFLSATGYQIQVTATEIGGNGCTFEAVPAWFTFAGAPALSLPSELEVCAEDEVPVSVLVNPGNSALTGFGWVLDGDTTTMAFPAPFVHQYETAGAFYLEAFATNACGSGQDSMLVTVHPTPPLTVSASNNWFCMGSYVDFVAEGEGEFFWNSSSTLLNGGQPGDSFARYVVGSQVVGSVFTTVDHGPVQCISSAGFSIYGFFVPSVTLALDANMCEGEPLEVQANIVSYGWDTSLEWILDGIPMDTSWAPTASVNASASFSMPSDALEFGEHVLEAAVVFDPYPVWLPDYGCSDTAVYAVSLNPLPDVSVPTSITFCDQAIAEVLPEGIPAGGVWSSEAGPIINNTLIPSEFGVGTFDLIYSYTDSLGCAAEDSALLIVEPPVWANAGPDSTLCESNDLVQLPLAPSGNSGQWSGPGIVDGLAGLLDLSDLDVGLTQLVYSLNSGSCATSDTAIWEVLEEPTAFLSTQGSVACDGDTVWMNLYAGGGNLSPGSDYSYEWSDLVTLDSTGSAYWIANTEEPFAIIGVIVTDELGCSDNAMTFIDPMPLPNIIVPSLSQECAQGVDVTLPPAMPANGSWSGPGVNGPAGTFNPGAAGVGTFGLIYTGMNALGCSNSDTAYITVVEPPYVSAPTDLVVCADAGDQVLTGFVPASGGTWSGAVSESNGVPVFVPQSAGSGIHELIYASGLGSCMVQDTSYAEVRSLPVLQIVTNSTVCDGDSVSLELFVDGPVAEYVVTATTGLTESADTSWVGWTGPWELADNPVWSATVVDSSGCAASVETGWEVLALPQPILPLGWSVCQNGSDVTLPEAQPDGGVWSGAGVEGSLYQPNQLTAGLWNLTYEVLDEFGCAGTDSMTVEVVDVPAFSLGPKLHACENDGFLALPTPLDWAGTWAGPALSGEDSVNIGALPPGTYSYAFSLEGQVCAAIDSVELEIHSLPAVLPLPMELVCPDSAVMLSVSVSGEAGPFTYNWQIEGETVGIDADEIEFSWDEPGTYAIDIQIVDAMGCATSAAWSTEVESPVDAELPSSISVCNQPVMVDLTDYVWSASEVNPSFSGLDGSSIAVTSDGSLDPSLLIPGSYQVEAVFTPIQGCPIADTTALIVAVPMAVGAGSDVSVCAGSGNMFLSSSTPELNPVWSGLDPMAESALLNANSGELDVNSLGDGTFSFMVAAGMGSCATADTLVLEVLPLPMIEMPEFSAFCSNSAAVTLSGVLPEGGTWTGPGVASASGTFNPVEVGSGSAMLTYAYVDPTTSCASNATVNVQVVVPTAVAIVAPEVLCSNAWTTIQAGSVDVWSDVTWWSNGEVIGAGWTLDWLPTTPGDWEVEVITTDSNGCDATASQAWVVATVPQVNIVTSASKGCAPFVVDVGPAQPHPDVTWNWVLNGTSVANGETWSTSLTADADTTEYIIELEIVHACGSSTAADTVLVLPAPTFDFSATLAHACVDQPIELTVQTSFADELTWEWNGNGGVMTDTLPFNPQSTGSQSFSLTAVHEVTGCATQSTWDLEVHAVGAFEIVSDTWSGCPPLNVEFTTDASDSQLSWNWDFGNGSGAEFASPSHTFEGNLTGETFEIVATATDPWGCTASAIGAIEVHPVPVSEWNLAADFLCGLPALLALESLEMPDVEVHWNLDGQLEAVGWGDTLSLETLGWHTVEHVVTNEFGCAWNAVDSIEVLPLPGLALSLEPMVGCAPLDVEFAIQTNAAEWSISCWQNGIQLPLELIDSTGVLENAGNYQFQLEGSSVQGCANAIWLEDSVSVLPRPMVDVEPNPYAGTWESPDPLNDSWVFENLSDPGEALWDFGDGVFSSEWDGTHSYAQAGTYDVGLLVVNEWGCSNEWSQSVTVEDVLHVFVPNAFTPPNDGYSDGVNDAWRPTVSNPKLIDRYHVVIYNRYGQVVWESNDPEAYWVGEAQLNGTHYGQNDLYTYVLRIDSRAQLPATQEWRGHIALIR